MGMVQSNDDDCERKLICTFSMAGSGNGGECQCVCWTDGPATNTNGNRPPNGTFSTEDSLLSQGKDTSVSSSIGGIVQQKFASDFCHWGPNIWLIQSFFFIVVVFINILTLEKGVGCKLLPKIQEVLGSVAIDFWCWTFQACFELFKMGLLWEDLAFGNFPYPMSINSPIRRTIVLDAY